ncbi:MAG TPA: YCF48-related protein, partial [Kofleriaceae bacterium]
MKLVCALLVVVVACKSEDKAKPAAEPAKTVDKAPEKPPEPPPPAVPELTVDKLEAVAATIDPKPGAEWKQVQKQVLMTGSMPVMFSKVVLAGQNGWALTKKSDGYMHATTDGGKKWSRVTTGDFYGISFADETNGYAIATGSIKRTTDGGKTWTDTPKSPNVLKGIWALGANEVCVISGESFNCSTDGAQTWNADAVSLGYIYHFHPGKTTRWLVGKQSAGKQANKMTLWRSD